MRGLVARCIAGGHGPLNSLFKPPPLGVAQQRLQVTGSRIKQMVFGHFSKCLYPLQKFDSDTERRFAVILERDADKWFKPAKGQFQLFYKLGVEQPEYVPDFVAEAAHFLLMVETKARNELGTDEVKAKAEAGALWCRHASEHAQKIGTKSWKYLLIPHDQVTEDKRLVDYLSFEAASR